MKYNFRANVVTEDLIEWIKDWFEDNGKNSNVIIGISGGKDSTICAKLCVEALGKDRVIGILLPHGDQHDFQTAIDVCEYLSIKYFVANIEDTYASIIEGVELSLTGEVSKQTKINLAPRIRMTYLRAFAQSLNGRLINTSNLSEDWVGYATIDGDTCGDMSPLSYLTVTEVKQIGHYLGIPSEFVEKIPEDGLVGISDEENLGITYTDLDKYICEAEGSKETISKIRQMFRNSAFKRRYTYGMPAFRPCLGGLYEYQLDEDYITPPYPRYTEDIRR